MINRAPIQAATDAKLDRWIAELTAARSLRLPDGTEAEHRADQSFIEELLWACTEEQRRRIIHGQASLKRGSTA